MGADDSLRNHHAKAGRQKQGRHEVRVEKQVVVEWVIDVGMVAGGVEIVVKVVVGATSEGKAFKAMWNLSYALISSDGCSFKNRRTDPRKSESMAK